MNKKKMRYLVLGIVLLVVVVLVIYMTLIHKEGKVSRKNVNWASMELSYSKGEDSYYMYTNFTKGKAIVKSPEHMEGLEISLVDKDALLAYLKEYADELLDADAATHYTGQKAQDETRYSWRLVLQDDSGESDQIISTKDIPECIKKLIKECNKALGQQLLPV